MVDCDGKGATARTYTVTVTVSNTDGTIETTSESVSTAPTITGFSGHTSAAPGKKLTTTVVGIGFVSTDTFHITTTNSNVTVVSFKVAKVSQKHPSPTIKLKLSIAKTATAGNFGISLTESGRDPGTTNSPQTLTIT